MINYTEDEKGEKVYDFENMRWQFEYHLDQLKNEEEVK